MLKAVKRDGELIIMIDSIESYKELERRLRYSRRKSLFYIQEISDEFLNHVETHPYAVVVGRVKVKNGSNSPYIFLTKQDGSAWQVFVDPPKTHSGAASKCVTTDVSGVWRDHHCVISIQKDDEGYKLASFQ